MNYSRTAVIFCSKFYNLFGIDYSILSIYCELFSNYNIFQYSLWIIQRLLWLFVFPVIFFFRMQTNLLSIYYNYSVVTATYKPLVVCRTVPVPVRQYRPLRFPRQCPCRRGRPCTVLALSARDLKAVLLSRWCHTPSSLKVSPPSPGCPAPDQRPAREPPTLLQPSLKVVNGWNVNECDF